jgi:hypothetical protein
MVSREGDKVDSLGFARYPEDIRAVVQALRDYGIQVTGPYETPKGTLVYTSPTVL